jgi:hypothetical protein
MAPENAAERSLASRYRYTVDKDRVRFEQFTASGESATYTVLIGGKQSTVSKRERSVTVCDKQCVAKMAQHPEQMYRMNEAQLASVPERHREAFRKSLGLGPQPQVVVRKTELTESVGQYRCSLWEVTLGGKLMLEACTVPFSSVPGGEELGRAYNADRLRWRAVELAQRQYAAHMLTWPTLRPPLEVEGLPVRVRDTRGTPSKVFVLHSIRTQAVAADAFQIPVDYRVKDMNETFAQLDSMRKAAPTLTPEQQRAQQAMWEFLYKVEAEREKEQAEKANGGR